MTAVDREAVSIKVLEIYKAETEKHLAMEKGFRVFDEPDVRFASADDPLIEDYKNIIGGFHWSPDEVLKREKAGTVISWCLPVSEEARLSNRKEKLYPSVKWAWTRTFGEYLNEEIRKNLCAWLEDHGHASAAPALEPGFGFIEETPVGIASQWSERHYAFAAGHGTFGLSGGLITRRGIAHRLGSVVTSAVFEADEREYGNDPFAWCLHESEGKCGACIKRCPVGSVGSSPALRDKDKCNEHDMVRISALYGSRFDWEGIYGCGLCQTKVPCESRRP